MAELTQEYLDQALQKQTGELKTYTDAAVSRQTEELAQIINSGFQSEHDYMERRLDELQHAMDIRKVLEEHQRKFQRIAEALHIEL